MSANNIHSIFEGFKKLKVLVIGDVMVDAYIWGSANRISPEAPVPVVKSTGKEFRLGGAANVALNVHSLGAQAILCGIIGEDHEGNEFLERLKKRQIDSSAIVRSKSRPTTVKTRVLSGYQHIVRIDSEQELALNTDEENEILSKVLPLLEEVDVVIFEDYNKGVLTKSIISKIIQKANDLNIPTVVDPKRLNFMDYKGATVFKPNLKELHEGLKLDHVLETIPEISIAAGKLQDQIDVKEVFLTLSEKGVLIKNKKTEIHIPAHVRTISDVSGAGDTVISIIALCKAMDLSPSFMAELANLGGGIVCEHVGVVPVDKDKLLEEADNYDIVKNL